MTYTQYSLDEGQTWHDVDNSIRIRFNEAAEDDDGFLDLHLTATSEGVIFDLWEQREDAECSQATCCMLVEDLVELTM